MTPSMCAKFQAMASNVDTPIQGSWRGQANPLAVDKPMRSPVKEPGPLATAMTSTWDSWCPQLSSMVWHMGNRVRLWVRPLF